MEWVFLDLKGRAFEGMAARTRSVDMIGVINIFIN